ncbi:MAG: barstar family protein [Parachlamydiales bacterium]|nr:barstar family protein [Parachlamydiales bacterium]
MFVFFSDLNEVKRFNYDAVVFIHKNISNEQELFNLFATQLRFPPYFGKNWDALYDCLSDLKWLKTRKILIIHEDIPFINMKKQRGIYITLLSDLEDNLDSDEELEIDVAFSRDYKKEIELVLKSLKES